MTRIQFHAQVPFQYAVRDKDGYLIGTSSRFEVIDFSEPSPFLFDKDQGLLYLDLRNIRSVVGFFAPDSWQLSVANDILTFFDVVDRNGRNRMSMDFKLEDLQFVIPAHVSESGAQLFSKGTIVIH